MMPIRDGYPTATPWIISADTGPTQPPAANQAARSIGECGSSRAAESWRPAAELSGQIVRSVTGGTFDSEPAMLAHLLEECFLVSYYASHPDRTAAPAVASLYVEWAYRDPGFRDEFLLHEVRVHTNLAFVEQRI
jgi:hypothetical protein